MRDVFSKVTFGFLMAQLAPGGLSALALFMLVTAVQKPGDYAIRTLAEHCLTTAFSSPPAAFLSLTASLALGMLLHGLNWACIGFNETRFEHSFNSSWHRRKIWLQVVLAPLQIFSECAAVLWQADSIPKIGNRENLSRIAPNRMAQFQFIQDFYLHFAQFFAHVSLAFLIAFSSMTALLFIMGTSAWRMAMIVATYLLAGLFFVLGRVQFYSLFRAELDLAELAENGKANTPTPTTKPLFPSTGVVSDTRAVPSSDSSIEASSAGSGPTEQGSQR
jgi:hypothetical protein